MSTTTLTAWAADHLGDPGEWVPASAAEFAAVIQQIGWEGCGEPYECGGCIWLPVDHPDHSAGGWAPDLNAEGHIRITEAIKTACYDDYED